MTDEPKRSSEDVTIVATASSAKSEDSTEHLICKTPSKAKSAKSPSVDGGFGGTAGVDSNVSGGRAVVALGLAQVALGSLLVGAGALAVVKGAALSRVGAGLWAGCAAVVTGVVGVLGGVSDCYSLQGPSSSGPFLTAFLALSLVSFACGNCAAALAAAGLRRDAAPANAIKADTFEDEMVAWAPVLTNIALLIIASVHCVVSLFSIYHVSRRVCPCFRSKRAYDHNQFDPSQKSPYVVCLDDKIRDPETNKDKDHKLCKELEIKLMAESGKRRKVNKGEEVAYGSASSRRLLVRQWLQGGGSSGNGKGEPRYPPMLLVPAQPQHRPAATMGRMPMGVLMPPPRYATLPLPPPRYPPAQLYYPHQPHRVRRRRTPRMRAERRVRRQGAQAGPLTRSLERIHRKRRSEAHRKRAADADLARTYTGLDRAYAEQFIAVCDESRLAAERLDSLASTSATSATSEAHTHAHPDSI